MALSLKVILKFHRTIHTQPLLSISVQIFITLMLKEMENYAGEITHGHQTTEFLIVIIYLSLMNNNIYFIIVLLFAISVLSFPAWNNGWADSLAAPWKDLSESERFKKIREKNILFDRFE